MEQIIKKETDLLHAVVTVGLSFRKYMETVIVMSLNVHIVERIWQP